MKDKKLYKHRWYKMNRAWVLMTAMPPTKGHLNLINFASYVGEGRARVIVCTQPSEPLAKERYYAVRNAASRGSNGADVEWLHRELPQDPNTPGFWPMWEAIMREQGFEEGDIWVTSEPYGQTLADRLGGTFIPYDPKRELLYTRATAIREDLEYTFDDIIPEFQKHLRTNVVVFGAEATGKTTLSKELARIYEGHWFFEWARPYLETVGPAITPESMNAIWRGQRATQKHAERFFDKAYAFFDTDLFSTVGYWEQPHWQKTLGPVPEGLIRDAQEQKADLYIIPRANIPFEEDPIRYGGNKQESPDEYWIEIARKYQLNYIVLDSNLKYRRRYEAIQAVDKEYVKKQALITYEREANG